jgi:hypothetical protein
LRLKVELETINNTAVSISHKKYKNGMANMVYSILSSFDKEFGHNLHEKGWTSPDKNRSFKLFSYSDLLGPGKFADEILHIDLPDDEFETLGGLVFNLLGHLPKVGEELILDNVHIKVEKILGRRIDRVRVWLDESGKGEENESSG